VIGLISCRPINFRPIAVGARGSVVG
jgi:hypothetical protein